MIALAHAQNSPRWAQATLACPSCCSDEGDAGGESGLAASSRPAGEQAEAIRCAAAQPSSDTQKVDALRQPGRGGSWGATIHRGEVAGSSGQQGQSCRPPWRRALSWKNRKRRRRRRITLTDAPAQIPLSCHHQTRNSGEKVGRSPDLNVEESATEWNAGATVPPARNGAHCRAG